MQNRYVFLYIGAKSGRLQKHLKIDLFDLRFLFSFLTVSFSAQKM